VYSYALDVASALAYIHRHGIVHLDVKPANIIVTRSDHCKLTDFGCSQRLPSPDEAAVALQRVRSWSSSPTKMLNGTLAYRAPELLRGEAATPAADVYSLGVTLWQMRSRSTPYLGRDQQAVVFAVVAYHDRPDTSPALRRRRSTAARRRSPAANQSACDGEGPAGGDLALTPDRQYRDVFRRCWNSDARSRPTAVELVCRFRSWTTELDSVSSTSSLDTDDVEEYI